MAGFRFRAKLRELFGRKHGSNLDSWLPEACLRPNGSGSFVEDNNDFAFAMYGQLRLRPGNLFFSPFSIRTALAMTRAGAKGGTAAQMTNALHISSSDEVLHSNFAEMIQRLNVAGRGKGELVLANSVWGQEGTPLQPGFIELLARYYNGTMTLVDFRHAPEATRETINKWVAEQTRQKIRDLIPAGSLDADTRLALVNAVYFKGMWVLPFDRAATRDEPFWLEKGGTVQAPLMYQQEQVRYLMTRGYQAVDLDYRDIDLSMLVLLPVRKDGLQHLERTLTARELCDCVARMGVREVELFLPRFTLSWGTVDLSEQFAALGMTQAFTPAHADFSGINGQKPPHEDSLFISAVYHKAFAEVNEEGTEAAAASAVLTPPTAAPGAFKPPSVPIFRADHPFLFAIRDRRSGTILFLGRVADPTRES